MQVIEKLTLPSNLRGRSIHLKVIPTVYNLRNMIEKLILAQGDFSKLKPWEQRSYKAYHINKIKQSVMTATGKARVELLKKHILSIHPTELGASCIDIYLVAFVAENIGPGKEIFYDYIKRSGISDKINSAGAIWTVGRGDGKYLGILNDSGSVKEWGFFEKWIKGE